MDDVDTPEIILEEYPDATVRETYPPLPSKGKPRNVPMPSDLASSWASNAEFANRKREQEGG